jgi:hypothetical protein
VRQVESGSKRGYDVPEEWMYFKAGADSQNKTGEKEDFD